MRIIALLSFLCLTISSHAQQRITLSEANSDCGGAIQITDSIFGPVNPPQSAGMKNEFNAPKNSRYFFEKEHHSVWYTINIQNNCTLSFDIIPEAIEDDYDFLLFKHDGEDFFCERLAAGKIQPLRSVISRNNKSLLSKTGLNLSASSHHIAPGPGSSYAAGLAVKKGEQYYLVLDNVYPNGKGHTLMFHYTACAETPGSPIEIAVEKPQILPSCYLSLKVSDKKSSELLNSSVKLKSFGEKAEEQSFDEVSSLMKALQPITTYNLHVSAPGYFSYSTEFRSPPSGESIHMDIKLDSIQVGNSIILDNIYFQGGTANFLPSSFAALRNLNTILRENPGVKIEIQGHVNKPLYLSAEQGDSPERLQKLSDERAYAVYEYMLKRGIEGSRIKWKGYSNTRMLHPHGRTEEEQQENRRVEILILAK